MPIIDFASYRLCSFLLYNIFLRLRGIVSQALELNNCMASKTNNVITSPKKTEALRRATFSIIPYPRINRLRKKLHSGKIKSVVKSEEKTAEEITRNMC